ncbi:MAG: cbb3-type cytochrome oxidase assembly protein CcoS [Pseudomonadales bacterium]|nr:cbb3-type cytochrome oxidase assembly protein CcoS [Pseudomonadales bacterium]
METLFILIPLGLILLGFAFWAFIWAVNKNQFDDLESPAQDIIFDDRQFEEERKNSTPIQPQADADIEKND